MIASNPSASAQSLSLQVGGHPHMRFLVDREHQRIVGRIDIEADNILRLWRRTSGHSTV